VVDAPDAVELPTIQGEINYDHVSFQYVEGREVIHDVNLHINPGETIAFVGTTRRGKKHHGGFGPTVFIDVTTGSYTIVRSRY